MDYLKLLQSKIITDDNLNALLTYWRLKDEKIVFTNGCFDLLHRGHVEYLARAASLGSILVVGLNSDASVRRLKGDQRPVQDEYSRALLTTSLRFVTGVKLFDEDTPYELIRRIVPDILVKGGDYKEEDIVGGDVVRSNGGEIVTIDFTEGYSTSGLIEKIRHS
jgi:rfaE bifunctional protein nucleotidyltransferase chain/domain